MSLVRVLKTAEVTLYHNFYVDETLTNASGAVTVTPKRLDGTAVMAPASATNVSTGRYKFVYPGYANLDTHTVDWSGVFGGSTTSVQDIVEIVGGFLFGIAELRALRPALDPNVYLTDELIARRTQVEQECERICRRAWVPRFSRVMLNGTGTQFLHIPHLEVSALRSVKTAVFAGATFQTVADLSHIAALPSGVLVRDDGNIWPEGHQNVIVELEYGSRGPTEEIKQASMRRCRSLLSSNTNTVPDRTVSYTTGEGAVYRLTLPSATTTGIPDIDAIYEGSRLDAGGFA